MQSIILKIDLLLVEFSEEVPLGEAKDFVDNHFINNIRPDFIIFLSALAGVAIFRSLTKI